jgi:hypothetical protein
MLDSSRYMRSQKKEWALATDLVLPWKTCRELPALLKEFPEALQEGIELVELHIEEQTKWLADEDTQILAKNPKRTLLVYKMAHLFCSTTNFNKLNEGNQVYEEAEYKMRNEPRERLSEAVFCPPLDMINCIGTFALHSIAQAWIDIISNLKIVKFQEVESKQNKKKKKKVKRKKADNNLVESALESLTPGDRLSADLMESVVTESNLYSAPYGKTIADEDTRCANGSSKSREKREVHKEIFSLDNAGDMHEVSIDTGANPLKKEASMPTSQSQAKQSPSARKAEFKREKRKALKRKQRTEGCKLKNLVMVVESNSSSFGSCNPLEKASCLSVAGSGVLLDYEDQSARLKKLQGIGNLIQIQRNTFFDEEEIPQIKDRSASLCLMSHQMFMIEARCSSLGFKRKMRPILQYGMVFEKKPNDPKKQGSSPLNKEKVKKPKKDSNAYQSKHLPKVAESKQSVKESVQADSASIKAVKPQLLGISRCVFEERQRMKQANYSTFQAMDLRTNYKRISKQSQNPGSNHEIFEAKGSYRRRGTQSTVTDKSSYGQRPTKERKVAMDRADNTSLLSGITSQDHDRSVIGNSLAGNSRMTDQLLLSESLNLPNYYESSPQSFENYQLLTSEDVYMPQYHFAPPYLAPPTDAEPPNVARVPAELLQQPAVAYLDAQARAFVDAMKRYSDSREDVRRVCKERIELVVQVSFMGAEMLEVKTYGSWDTGLSIPGSDIDLLISTPGVDKEVAIKMLETLEENLKDFSWTKKLRNILSAQIPVLKIKVDAGETLTKELFPIDAVSEAFLERNNRLTNPKERENTNLLLSVDIIVEASDNSALKTTRYVVDSCQKWPELRGLVLLMKYFLARKNLTNPYTGSFR